MQEMRKPVFLWSAQISKIMFFWRMNQMGTLFVLLIFGAFIYFACIEFPTLYVIGMIALTVFLCYLLSEENAEEGILLPLESYGIGIVCGLLFFDKMYPKIEFLDMFPSRMVFACLTATGCYVISFFVLLAYTSAKAKKKETSGIFGKYALYAALVPIAGIVLVLIVSLLAVAAGMVFAVIFILFCILIEKIFGFF